MHRWLWPKSRTFGHCRSVSTSRTLRTVKKPQKREILSTPETFPTRETFPSRLVAFSPRTPTPFLDLYNWLARRDHDPLERVVLTGPEDDIRFKLYFYDQQAAIDFYSHRRQPIFPNLVEFLPEPEAVPTSLTAALGARCLSREVTLDISGTTETDAKEYANSFGKIWKTFTSREDARMQVLYSEASSALALVNDAHGSLSPEFIKKPLGKHNDARRSVILRGLPPGITLKELDLHVHGAMIQSMRLVDNGRVALLDFPSSKDLVDFLTLPSNLCIQHEIVRCQRTDLEQVPQELLAIRLGATRTICIRELNADNFTSLRGVGMDTTSYIEQTMKSFGAIVAVHVKPQHNPSTAFDVYVTYGRLSAACKAIDYLYHHKHLPPPGIFDIKPYVGGLVSFAMDRFSPPSWEEQDELVIPSTKNAVNLTSNKKHEPLDSIRARVAGSDSG